MTIQIQQKGQGPVTADDVRCALLALGVESGETNAKVVRDAIGRGSMQTIQKHLEAVRRDALGAQQSVDAPTVPAAPAEAVAAMWAAAHMAAEALVRRRLDSLATERDTLVASRAALQSDVDALASQCDDLVAKTGESERARGIAEQVLAEAEVKHKDTLANLGAQLEAAASALGAAEKEHAHVLELAVRDREIERASLQGTIDRLVGQLAEVKSLLRSEHPATSK